MNLLHFLAGVLVFLNICLVISLIIDYIRLKKVNKEFIHSLFNNN